MASQSTPRSSSGPVTRPLSPWAKRFNYNTGGRHPLLDDGEEHSGLAPQLPVLHPKYYADVPPYNTSHPTKLQLDHLFLTESFQRSYLKGLESWEVGPLMRHVWFTDKIGVMSGGHRECDYGPVDPTSATSSAAGSTKEDATLQIFHTNRIQINENKWYKFLQKNRWYDLVQPEPILGGGNWSVDNPKVWEVLSISLELVDRMLKALIEDKNETIDTILFGLLAHWNQAYNQPEPIPDAHVLLSRDEHRLVCQERNWPCAIDQIPMTTECWTARLEYLMMLQCFSFTDQFGGQPSTWGITMHNIDGMIAIDIGPLRNLLSSDLTLSERCLLHYTVAVTMIHEMFHSLTQFRKMDRNWDRTGLPHINWMTKTIISEPFIDTDGACEMGYAAEQRLFGGQLYQGPINCNDKPFGAYRMPWPEPWSNEGFEDKSHPCFMIGTGLYTERVSALYASKLLSSAFWDDPKISQKSINRFHFNPIFSNSSSYCGSYHDQIYGPTIVMNPLPSPLDPGELEMIESWNERHIDWIRRRKAWFLLEQPLWADSPWAYHRHRLSILMFARAFNSKDELQCRDIAFTLTYKAAWNDGRDDYMMSLPPHTSHPHMWVFHAIGLLMFAALPIRHETREDMTVHPAYTLYFTPSIAAAAQKRQPRHFRVLERRKRDDLMPPANVFFDALTRENEWSIKDFSNESYLDLLSNALVQMGTAGAALSSPWLREITRAAEDLRRQRRDVRRGTRESHSWATWKFVIPAYNNTMSKYVDGQWKVQI